MTITPTRFEGKSPLPSLACQLETLEQLPGTGTGLFLSLAAHYGASLLCRQMPAFSLCIAAAEVLVLRDVLFSEPGKYWQLIHVEAFFVDLLEIFWLSLSNSDFLHVHHAVFSHSFLPDSLEPQRLYYQASLSMRILQARTLECASIPSSRGSSQPRNRTQVSSIAGGFFTIRATRESPSCTQNILNWPYIYFLHLCSQESSQKLTRVPEVTSDWNVCHSFHA